MGSDEEVSAFSLIDLIALSVVALGSESNTARATSAANMTTRRIGGEEVRETMMMTTIAVDPMMMIRATQFEYERCEDEGVAPQVNIWDKSM